MVDSPAAAGAKGSSPWEDRKSFSMVLLEVRILPYTPSFESRQAKSYKEATGRTYPWRVTDFRFIMGC
jgi:hypothetical protein